MSHPRIKVLGGSFKAPEAAGSAIGLSFLKTYIFVSMWVVVCWFKFFFFNLLAWRNFLFGCGNYPFLICKLITHLIIHEPPSATYLNLFLAQSLKPQRETVRLLLYLNVVLIRCLTSQVNMEGTSPGLLDELCVCSGHLEAPSCLPSAWSARG